MITGTLTRYKYPGGYGLKPLKIDVGANWITLNLKRRIDEEN